MRIGLFGGSFDPPHAAHRALARAARDALALDELRWVVAGRPWQKIDPVTGAAPSDAAHREAMVRLAIAGEPGFVLERAELERPGPSYMVDTVAQLQSAPHAAAAQWFLVIGADQLARLHTWHRWRALLARVTLAVAQRPGAAPQPAPEVAQALLSRPSQPVPLPPMAVSSTEIRRRAAAGQALDGLVAPQVARYIERHALYRAAAPGAPRS
jgi:nicotinate-nucleotide adenylyltransferase